MIEDEDDVAPAAGASGKGGDAAALAIALGQAGTLDPRAAAYLEEQTVLSRLQIRHFAEERRLADEAALRKRYYDRIKNLFATIAVALVAGLTVLLGAMVVDALGDHGLVIEPFSVPPSLAGDGLTGDVVASRFLDKLQAMQTATQSERPADSYQNNWGSQIKVEIPETGLTFGELQKLLREKLGHATHVTGEVLNTPAGISITARWGTAPPQTFTGPLGDFDRLTQRSAEAVYRASQPYRFAQFLAQHDHIPQALGVLADLATSTSASERGWAYAEWGTLDLNEHGDVKAARSHLSKAYASGNGPAIVAGVGLLNLELWSGHDEKVLELSKLIAARAQARAAGTTEDFFESNRLISIEYLAGQVGDFRQSAEGSVRFEALPAWGVIGAGVAADAFVHDHDPAAAKAQLAPLGVTDDTAFLQMDADNGWLALPVYWIAADADDWQAALADARASDAWLQARKPAHPLMGLLQPVLVRPLEALALAKAGNLAAGEALIGDTPRDCYLCIRVRGQIAAEKGDWPAALHWFADAARQAPSVPFAYAEWGQVLLARGDLAGAIAKFRMAREKGPHFADPLEMWGEALIRQNRSDLALAKFEEAAKYAPAWGRLHLKWGEALLWSGDKSGAARQFAAASGLDLTSAEKAELARRRAGHG